MDIFKEEDNVLSIGIDNITKSNLSKMADGIIHNVLNGNTDALHEYIKAKALSELAGMMVEGLKEVALNEADKYAGQESIFGCKVVVKSTPSSYDFSHDDEWRILSENIESLKTKLKERESEMIEATKYAELVSTSGEVIPPAEIKKQGGTTLSITIPR
jgi:hypothetical protein